MTASQVLPLSPRLPDTHDKKEYEEAHDEANQHI